MVKNYFLRQSKADSISYLNNIKKILFLAVFLFLVGNLGFGQTLNYTFSKSSGTYTSISGGTVHYSGAACTTDGVTAAVTIPSFTYNGTAYTSVRISNNGFITFGATAPTAATYNPIASTTLYNGAIAGYGYNLVASTVSGVSPEIMSLLSGSEFIIQFKDVARSTNPGSDRMNFQIRLNTSTNEIKVVYGTCITGATSITATNFGQVGLRGSTNAFFNNLQVNGTAPYDTWAKVGGAADNANTPLLAPADNAGGVNVMRYTSTCVPASGQTYAWTPILSAFYQSLPYTQNFDAWNSYLAVNDVPSTSGINNIPSTGNYSWRNTTESTTNSLWNSTSGQFIGATQAGIGAATFNQYNGANGGVGNLDFYLNFSTSGTKQATFYVKNPGTSTANDILNVYLSTNGGLSFLPVGTYAAPINSWTLQTITLGASVSSNCILRFQGVSDWGTSLENLGIDELSVMIMSPCVTPTAQPGSLNFMPVTATTLSGSFTAASPAPSKYLVVRSTSATAPSPVDGTIYSVGSTTLGAGTYVVSNSDLTTFSDSGLTNNTRYYYYVFSYNDSCTGTAYYLTSSPLSANTYTCLTAPTANAGTGISNSGFTANWVAVAGATGYLLDVSTSNTFSSFVSGYNGLAISGGSTVSHVVTGLSPVTTYYFRVRATNVTSCTSANSSTITVSTICAAETAPTTLQTFASYTGFAPNPICWSEATGTLSASSTLVAGDSEWFNSSGFANAGTNVGVKTNLYGNDSADWLITQPIDLGAVAGLYRVSYKMAVTSYNGTASQTTLGTHIVNLVVSTDGGITWSNSNIIKSYTGVATYSNTGITETVNLTGYSGVIKIAFVATTSSNTPDIDFHIDDFIVEILPSCLPPTALTTTAIGATTATFSWTAPSLAPASYDIYYGVGSVATPLAVPTALTVATTTSATNTLSVSSLNTNTSYQYYVRSACGGSDGNSTWAGPYTFLTACTAPSTQPTALNLTLITATTLSGSFTAASPVPSGYLVVRSLSPSLSANPIDATTYTAGNALGGGTVVQSGTSLTFTQTGLTANNQYYYFVFSFNNTSCSSGPKYLVTSPLTANSITCLATPTSSVATGVTPNSFVANWVSVTGATGYILDVATNSGFTAFVPGYNALALGAVTSHSISGLASNITYYYRVRATNSTTCTSANSTSQTAYTLAPPLNDDCTSATTLPCGTSNMAGTTVGSISEVLSVSAWNASPYGVWYTFIGDGTLNLISTTSGSGFDHRLSIARGTCVSLTNVVTVDNASGGASTETYKFTPELGAVYYVYISYYGSSGSASNTGTFTISRTCNVPYCTPSSSLGSQANNFINKVSFLGTLNDISNTSTYSSTSVGYEDFTSLPTRSSQIQGEPINVSVDINTNSYLKAWVDWNKDGDFTDSGETIFDSNLAGALLSSATFGFVIPNVLPGDYRIRIRTRGNATFDSCLAHNSTDTEDYLFTIISRCAAEILTVTGGERCGPGNVNLSATGTTGVQFKWYTAAVGGSLVATTTTGSYTANVTSTTSFYVTAFNGICETEIRKEVVATVKELADITIPASLEACGEASPIVLTASADRETVYLLNENFESGLGTMSSVENGSSDAIAKWRIKTGPFKPNEALGTWLPVISSGFGSNTFVTATSDMGIEDYLLDNSLQPTNVINTTGFLNLNLKFRMYFSRFYTNNLEEVGKDEFVTVEVSTNGGTTWITTPIVKYVTDIGNPGNFQHISLNLNAYINQSSLKFRIRYKTQKWTHGLAVDDIQLYGEKTLVPSFTWSGAGLNVFSDAALTIPYMPGTPASTVYAVPDVATLGNASFNIDVSTTVTNGCSITRTINVTNKSKVWNGSVSSVWNNANNWSPVGVPSSTDCIIIPSTTVKPIISSDANGKNLEIKALGELVVNSNKTLAIEDDINVKTGGSLMFENSASLIQTNENPSINTGNIIYKRNTSNMLRYSYTYWASPVYATSQTLFALSSGTLADKYYSWNINSQSWLLHRNGGITMEKAKGYIVRAPQTFPIAGTAASYPATFNGVPNNGLITIATQGSTTQDMWNLIGNPYPSALIADSFLSNTINPDLEGTIYLWTNFAGVSSVPNSGGTYSYTDNDYAVYNFSGGTTTAPATGSSIEPTGFVAAGQAFFVKGISNGSGTATFNNTMRKGEDNNQFFRRSSSHIEKNRLWLNLENAQGGFNQALIAYIEGATDNYDRGYDGELFGGNSATFYSLIPSKRLTIQGKALPFTENDIVPMGYKTTVAGNYKITLDHFDGLFESQNIYIKDNLLNVIHDIKIAPYNFTSAVGTFENRFEVVYHNEYLDVADPNFNTESVIIYQKDKFIYVNAGLTDIDQLKVFDIHGRLIYEAKKINSTEAVIKNLPSVDQVLIIQIISVKGNKVSKKLVH